MKNLTKAQLMDQLTEARNVIDRQRIVIAELEAKVSAKATVVEVAPVITVEKAVQGDKAKAILWSALKKHEKVSLNCLQEAFKDVSFKKALDEAIKAGVVRYKRDGKDLIMFLSNKGKEALKK